MYPTHALDAVKSVGGFFVPGQAWSSSPKMPLATAPPLSPPVFPSTTTEQQQRHDSSPLYVPGITQGPAPPADISLAEAMNAIHMKEGTAGLAESLRNMVATTKAEQGSGGSAITTGVAASIDLTRVWEPLDGLKYWYSRSRQVTSWLLCVWIYSTYTYLYNKYWKRTHNSIHPYDIQLACIFIFE